eukprot:9326005-Ditylum_brightwellii.AAC.1
MSKESAPATEDMDVEPNDSITLHVGDKLCKFFLDYGIFLGRVTTIMITPQVALYRKAINFFHPKEVGVMNYQFVKNFCNGGVFSEKVIAVQDSGKHAYDDGGVVDGDDIEEVSTAVDNNDDTKPQ